MVPSIAFQVPDIAAEATLQLKSPSTGKSLACITSNVSNGKTFSVPAVSYVAAGITGAALVIAGVSAIGAAAAGGTTAGSGTMSPSFAEIIGWFQGIAINGMFSVNYPPIYRAWTKNFAFSTGIIPWTKLQTSIDGFRAGTGGNLTNDNVQFLQNATLLFTDGTSSSSASTLRRALDGFANGFALRDITTSVNSSSSTANGTSALSQIELKVSGVTAYVEQLAVPQANTFMTALLIAGTIIVAIVVSILLFKLILEFWALFGSFPKSLTGFRKHYWGTMARSIVQLILILYSIWVMYCIFEL
jgi:Transient receptor potential (TRP) ion channel/ML-like domain